jgi:hypothetical protein
VSGLTWDQRVAAFLWHFYCLDDLGVWECVRDRYAGLEPRAAALAFGDAYDLERADQHWGPHTNRPEPEATP